MSLNIELLESSFARIKQQEAEFIAYFYDNLFANYPELKPLFVETQMEKQAKKLFTSLVLVVENLRNPDTLSDALKSLGTRHLQYGVLPEHYPMVGTTLLQTISRCLGDEWTIELDRAWSEAYAAVTQLMSIDTK
jgi:hemoglobin-like flavoprotein